MKNKFLIILSVILVCLAVFLTGCQDKQDINQPYDTDQTQDNDRDDSGNDEHEDNPQTNPDNPSEIVKTYAVTFDLDGGNGNCPNVNVKEGESTILPYAPTKTGYTFVGWDVDGNILMPRVSVIINKNITIKAVWQKIEESFRVTFNCNGGIGSAEHNQITVKEGSTITLPSAPQSAELIFLNWSDGIRSYNPKDTYTVTKNVTFTAIYDDHLRNSSTNQINNSALLITKSNQQNYTINGYTASIEDQFDLQFDVLAKSILARIGVVYGRGYSDDPNFVDTETSFTTGYKNNNSYNGQTILIKSKELVDIDKDYFGDPVVHHITGGNCQSSRTIGNIDCVGCWSLAYEMGLYKQRTDMTGKFYLRNAIMGSTEYSQYSAERWNLIGSSSGENSISIQKLWEYYHQDLKNAIANIVAYGENRDKTFNEAIQDI